MRKALRIISLSAGIISVVSAVILGCIYLEAAAEHVKGLKHKVIDYIKEKYIANQTASESEIHI